LLHLSFRIYVAFSAIFGLQTTMLAPVVPFASAIESVARSRLELGGEVMPSYGQLVG
jgi:hypothetical protein